MFRLSMTWLWHFLRAGYVAVLGELLYIAHLAEGWAARATIGDAARLAAVPEMVETLAAAAMLLTAGLAVGLDLIRRDFAAGKR